MAHRDVGLDDHREGGRKLVRSATERKASESADAALLSWFAEGVDFVRRYAGVVELMAAAIADPASALHASCTRVRAVGPDLLARAQEGGSAREDLDGIDLFALMAALGWLGEQSAFAGRAARLLAVVGDALLVGPDRTTAERPSTG